MICEITKGSTQQDIDAWVARCRLEWEANPDNKLCASLYMPNGLYLYARRNEDFEWHYTLKSNNSPYDPQQDVVMCDTIPSLRCASAWLEDQLDKHYLEIEVGHKEWRRAK